MKLKAYPFRHRPLAVAGVAAMLLSAAVAAVMISAPAPKLERADAAVVLITKKVRCEECGFVESTREIREDWVAPDARMRALVGERSAADTPRSAARHHAVIVRMNDGSIRVFIDLAPIHWRTGERLILIGGATRSGG